MPSRKLCKLAPGDKAAHNRVTVIARTDIKKGVNPMPGVGQQRTITLPAYRFALLPQGLQDDIRTWFAPDEDDNYAIY